VQQSRLALSYKKENVKSSVTNSAFKPPRFVPERLGIQSCDLLHIPRKLSLQQLQTLPGQVAYYAVDLADQEKVRQWIDQVERTFGRIDGVIHAAGNVEPGNFKGLERTDQKVIDAHFGPKIQGLIHLFDIFKDKDPDFVWITSSLATVLGGLTYGAYLAANLFMDHFITAKKLPDNKWLCVDLDGLSLTTGDPGSLSISGPELIEVFERSFQLAGTGRVMVSTSSLNERMEKSILKRKKQVTGSIRTAGTWTGIQKPSLTNASHTIDLTATEKKLMDAWMDFFGTDRLDANSDFFELGGDSLKAMTLSKRIYKEFDVDIQLTSFFANPTIHLLAREIDMAAGVKKLETGSQQNKNLKALII